MNHVVLCALAAAISTSGGRCVGYQGGPALKSSAVWNPFRKSPAPVRGAKLVALTPSYDEAAHGIYVEHLKNVFTDRENGILNIAVTGGYGAGKSSVLAELASERSKRTVTIALSSLGEDSGQEQDGSRAAMRSQSNKIQKEIVKQLLYRADPPNVRASRFRRITRFRWSREITLGLFLAGVAFAVMFLGGFADRFVALFGETTHLKIVAHATVYALLVITILGTRYALHNRVWVEKLGAGPATVALSNQSASFFDEYLDEIVYFFEATPFDTVIFEDIDRFDNPLIFETLRELNTILNTSKQLDGRPIRFIYALRDSIFEQSSSAEEDSPTTQDMAEAVMGRANRTKFFDLVVPIVPFISHVTAGDLMAQQMRQVGSIAPALIDLTSKHITDMRLIKNIRNEFAIFQPMLLSGGFDNLAGLTHSTLFALLCYKNIHLADFDKIKDGRSELDTLYNMARELVELNIVRINDEIDQARSTLSGDDEQELASYAGLVGDRLVAYIHRLQRFQRGPGHITGQVTVSLAGQYSSVGHFNDPEHPAGFDELRTVAFWARALESPVTPWALEINGPYASGRIALADLEDAVQERVSLVHWSDARRAEVQARIAQLELDKQFLREASMADLAYHPEFRTATRQSMDDLIDDTLKSKLAAELVRRGYIDWNFSLYVGRYYAGRITVRAKNFIVHQVQRNVMGVSISLTEEDAEDILRESIDSVGDRSLYNVSIFNFLLSRNPTSTESDYWRSLTDQMLHPLTRWGSDEQTFVKAYVLEGRHEGQFVRRLSAMWGYILMAIFELDIADDRTRLMLVDDALVGMDGGRAYEVSSETRAYIANHYADLTIFTGNPDLYTSWSYPEAEDHVTACRILEQLSIRLPSLDLLREGLHDMVVERSLYTLTTQNLADALRQDSAESIALDRLHAVNPTVFGYAIANAGVYAAALARDNDARGGQAQRYTVDAPESFVGIISTVFDYDAKAVGEIARLAAPDCRVNDLDEVDPQTWPPLMLTGRIAATAANVWAYIENYSVDDALVELLRTAKAIGNWSDLEPETQLELAECLVSSAQIGSADVRVRLIHGAARPLDLSHIPPENGQLYGLLIQAGFIDENPTNWERINHDTDWETREFAIIQSPRIMEHDAPTLVLTTDLADLFASERIPVEIKDRTLLRLPDYPQPLTQNTVAAAARYADSVHAVVTPEILTLMASGGAPTNTIIALANVQPANFTESMTLQLWTELGPPYAGVVDPATTAIRMPKDEAHQLFVNKFKKACKGWTSRAAGTEITMTRKQ